MDFGKLLLKEIDRKRKLPAPSQKKKARKNVSPQASPSVVPDLDAKREASSGQPDNSAHQCSQENVAGTNAAPALDSISDEQLLRSIASLDPHPETLSKEEQLHKLEILVRRDKQNARYSEYLELENAVPAAVELDDIAAASRPDVARRLTMQVRKFIKQIVRVWEADPASPFAMSLLEETKRDVVRLMYKLRSEKLASDVLVSLCTIVYYIQAESFAKANEAYMKLSIGNVAWPIGVRDVGIHARAADAKITGNDKTSVANIMQNEKTRRWIIAVKRLLNYCEHRHGHRAE